MWHIIIAGFTGVLIALSLAFHAGTSGIRANKDGMNFKRELACIESGRNALSVCPRNAGAVMNGVIGRCPRI
jgi:hypothetical protein